jgi:hypothetical protein
VLIYRFDAKAGEHVLRLLEPVADRRPMKTIAATIDRVA